MSAVSFVKVHETDKIEKAMLNSLNLIHFDLSRKIENVVIKPNLCYYWDYTTGLTTDPRIVAALISLLREQVSADVRITIVESDASAMKCEYAFKVLGYSKLAERHKVELMNLSEDKSETRKVAVGNREFHFEVPKTIQEADLRINVPKIKYGAREVKITCALKNIYGCNPFPLKHKYHKNINEVIVGLNKVMKFDLCIVDGFIVSGVKPLKLGLLMASSDPVAIDTSTAELLRINPRSVPAIMLASREKLGTASFTPKGLPPRYFAEKFPCRDYAYEIKSKLLPFVGLIRTRLNF